MKTHARKIAIGLMTGAALLLVSGWTEADATGYFSCSNRTLKGSFGTNLSGFNSGDGVTQIPVAEVGLFKLDGRGGLIGTDTLSVGGNVFARQFKGTYAVATDCTVEIVTKDGNGQEFRTTGVIVDGGDAAYLISTNAGDSLSGSAKRVGSLLFDRD
jgi:hypothetical protein